MMTNRSDRDRLEKFCIELAQDRDAAATLLIILQKNQRAEIVAAVRGLQGRAELKAADEFFQ